MTPGLLAILLAIPPQTPPPCRVAAMELTSATKAPNLQTESSTACSLDRKAVTWTCKSTNKDSRGTTTTTHSVTTYKSIADIVDEIAVIPPLRRAVRVDSSFDGPHGSGKNNVVYTYDSQNRLVQDAATSSTGATAKTTYSSWDAQGRPTAAGMTMSSGPGSTMTLKYDDAARVQTMTTEAMGQRITCEVGFDANGHIIANSCRGPAGVVSTTKSTIGKTEKICR